MTEPGTALPPWVAIFDCDGTLMDMSAPLGPAVFPAIPAMLGRLRETGWLCAVCTGRSRASLADLLIRNGLMAEIAAMRTPDDGPSKPHPDSLLDLLGLVGGVPDRAVMIGDGLADREAAGHAGIAFVQAAWHGPLVGMLPLRSGAGVAREIDDLDGLLAAIRNRHAAVQEDK